MEHLLRELTEPFDALPEAEALALLAEHWSIDASSLERLDTERDDTFRLRADRDYVLKVAHPLDSPALIDLQNAAMTVAYEARMPVQHPIGGTALTRGRTARVLTWLPGGLMRDAQYGLGEIGAAGSALARLALALREFEHPAARRQFAWDLQSFGAYAGIDTAGLPHQVIHNDFHPGNLLVDAGDPRFVTGILDFGDTVYAPRVQDVAVALAYLVDDDPGPVIAAFVAGYESVTPLLPAEHAALVPLIAARLRQRITLPPLLYPDDVDPAHTARLTRILGGL